MEKAFDLLDTFYYAPFAAFSIIIILIGILLICVHKHISETAISCVGYFIGQIQSKSQKNGKMYSSVYKFTANDGLERICRSGGAASMITSKKIGRPQKIRYKSNNPNQAKVQNNSYLYMGLLCLILGFILGAIYFSTVSFGILSFLSVLAFILYIAVTIYSRFDGVSLQEKIDFFEKNKDIFKKLEKNTKPIQKYEVFLGEESFKTQQNKQTQTVKKWLPIHFLLAVGFIGGGAYSAISIYEFEQQAYKTQGIVKSMKQTTSTTDNSTSYTYAPIVRYEIDGKVYNHTSKVSSSKPSHKQGDSLTILYNPSNPEDALLERGMWNYITQMVLIILGIGILLNILRIKRKG